ncbi:MAG: amidase [Beijerinckiaceae bacterium]
MSKPSSQSRNDPALWTMEQASRALASGRISSLELTRACLARIEAINPKLNAFLAVEKDESLKAARAADRARAKGDKRPLLGIPLAQKDMFARKGKTMSRGAAQPNGIEQQDCAVIARLNAAGALNLGPLHMNEFAFGVGGHNDHFGHAHNAWDVTRVTGGSSSGSGTAVAARLIFGALGSDTGGSVRLPAHFCGITGLKTTFGRVSRAGAMPLSFTLDTIGPLARTAVDAAMMLQVIAGFDADDATALDIPVPNAAICKKPVAGMTVGIPAAFYFDNLDAGVAKAADAMIAQLKRMKVKVKTITLPDQMRINAACQIILGSEAAAIHRPYILGSPEKYGAQVRSRIENGYGYTAVEYIEALRFRSAALAEHIAATQGCDAVLTPVSPKTAPTTAETDVGGAPGAEAVIQAITRFTRPANTLGLPTLTVPSGFGENNMPVGLQFVGRPFEEDRLLMLGAGFQRETDFHEAMPDIN